MIIPCPSCSARYNLPDIALGGKPRKVHCSKCGHMWVQKPGDGLPAGKPGAKPGARPVDKAPIKKKKKKPPPAPAPIEPADEPLERFPGMGGFSGLGGLGDDDHTVGAASLGDDAWANIGHHDDDFAGHHHDDRTLMEKVRDAGRWIGFAAGIAGLVVFVLGARGQIVDLWPAAARLYDVVGLPVEPPGAGLQFQNVKSEQRLDNGATVLVLEGQIANISSAERAVPPVLATSFGADHKPVKSWRVMVTQARLEPGAIATFRSQERDPGAVAEIAVTFVAE